MVLRRGIVATVVVVNVIFQIQICLSEINRQSFPKGFVFGTAASAFQNDDVDFAVGVGKGVDDGDRVYEGAVKEGGRGLSVWDTFSHSFGKIQDGSNADVAVNQYHRYDEDVQLMKEMGMDAYRFSISWSRIFPNGTRDINQEGIDHYNKLINALLAKGIEPYVTLYHWDLPQALEDKYNGWLSSLIIKDFATYAEICFQKFGDRVKHWITFNEPHTFAMMGYDLGLEAPGRCSVCGNGNSATEPYIVAHNVLISHAIVADVYRKKYKKIQGGSIGMSLDVMWFEPATSSKEDIEATHRALDFQLGWFLDPLIFGDYPTSMRSRVGNRLPKFSKSQASLLKGSLDFVGINHYTTFYAFNIPRSSYHDYIADSGVFTFPFNGTNFIGEKANSIWLYIVPHGMRNTMNYIKHTYGNPIVIVTENGMDDPNDPLISIKDALKDEKRIKYHNDYLINLQASITEDGCNVQGYFVWSLLDNWEWQSGFTSRFGLYFIDYKDNLKRYPKHSVEWFKNFLKST
ncbi:beta-glucosidase 40-like [Glycine soja]|nr:beta-glucosidase 40-like [Glycine soja]